MVDLQALKQQREHLKAALRLVNNLISESEKAATPKPVHKAILKRQKFYERKTA